MQGRYHDGIAAGSHEAQASFDGRFLTIQADGQTHQWPIGELSVDIHGGEARVSRRRSDARLIVQEADWRAAAVETRMQRRPRKIALIIRNTFPPEGPLRRRP